MTSRTDISESTTGSFIRCLIPPSWSASSCKWCCLREMPGCGSASCLSQQRILDKSSGYDRGFLQTLPRACPYYRCSWMSWCILDQFIFHDNTQVGTVVLISKCPRRSSSDSSCKILSVDLMALYQRARSVSTNSLDEGDEIQVLSFVLGWSAYFDSS